MYKGNTLIPVVAIVFAIAAFTTVGYFWWTGRETVVNTNTAVCTEEAKICPDGRTVGRTGPNCEFAPCPGGH